MSTGMGTTASDDVAPGAPQPTHIDVHIHQEPALLSFLQRPSAPNTPTPSRPLGSKRVLVASWVVQIVLGLMSGALGGLGCFLFYDFWSVLRAHEAGIWTGVVAVLAGVTIFIHDKRGGTCWALLRTLLALAAFATAIAAIHIGAYHFYHSSYWYIDWCDLSRGWDSPPPPSTPEEARREELCLFYQNMIQALSTGLLVILMSIWALLLLTSLVPVLLFCWRRLRPKAGKDQKKALLGASETQPCLS
ncbi:transmembrane protein 176A [Desmodus rotundus]|uniref:transmembrane protein 176A n=1 Tax=Desmodus rotundus TaxID=9430 RepID=UPI002380E3DC|nr:transmembrane protein 176A [Desmodus rotundus]XP_024420292.2 transmembrane protein 176A [Desmodus rotundus]XP_024420293.2 transmembrane protein 176A [Desmodus rotundus]